MNHFWRSRKYFERCVINLADTTRREALLSDGRIVGYHWITDSPDDHKSGWDDAEYVGTGEVYSIDGVIQMECLR